MWIISTKYGAFNTDVLEGIRIPAGDYRVVGCGANCRHPISDNLDDYKKIIKALKNGDNIVEVD